LKTPRKGTHAPGEAFSAKTRLMMKYRDIEYTVVQGIERGVWKMVGVGRGRGDHGPSGNQI
jgi:hypothetical protein